MTGLHNIKTYYNKHPLRVIVFTGLLLRVIAAVFSKGYGWSDDQFLIIEIAQSWINGNDFYGWLPLEDGNREPEGFSFFYVGFHYLLFRFLEITGISNPEVKMLYVRILHALWSMLIIYYGYLITLKLSNASNARTVGWLLALFWIFPMLSVRNLAELVSVPPLMIGLWLMVKNGNSNGKFTVYLYAGLIMGIAFNIRFQSALIIGSMGLAMLLTGKWKQTLLLAIGTFISIGIFQGGIDYFIWNKPFAQIIQYISYNADGSNIATYPQGPWYLYLLFLTAIIIPPVCIFMYAGIIREWRNLSIVTIAIFVFVIFHSYYPNKQERFIVTILPFLFIAGVIGWNKFLVEWNNKKAIRFSKRSWNIFWIINILLLIPITLTYSKKARVESMVYLSQYNDFNTFIINDASAQFSGFPPQFYLNHYYNYSIIDIETDMDSFIKSKLSEPKSDAPGFILFYRPDNLNVRVNDMKTLYPNLVYETTIYPGFIDMVLHKLNPINANEEITIYRNTDVVK